MAFKLYLDPVIPESPLGLCRCELQTYLGVGRNEVTPIARRFQLEKVRGHYPDLAIWRQLFGLAPVCAVGTALLRERLVPIGWVSAITKIPQSTIRSHIHSGSWEFPAGVQLGDPGKSAPARLRRWRPDEIRSGMARQ